MKGSRPLSIDMDALAASRAKNPLLYYCINTYKEGRDNFMDFHRKIEAWNEFADMILFDTENAKIGGQIVIPQLRKLLDGMVIPDGRLEQNQLVDKDSVVYSEQFVRSEMDRQRINKIFEHNRLKCKKDGSIFWVGKINEETGEMYTDFVRRRNIVFDARAESINEMGSLNPAQWKFEIGRDTIAGFRSTWLAKLAVKHGKAGAEKIVNSIATGYPTEFKSDIDDSVKTNDNDHETLRGGNEIGIMDVMCKAAPIEFNITVGNIKYKVPKGEPFHAKIAGGNGKVLCLYTGEDFIWRWAHKKTQKHPLGEPFFPLELLMDSKFSKGLECIGYWGIVKPYIEKIIRYEELLHKYVTLVADPDFILNFKRSGARPGGNNNDNVSTTKNWVALNLKKKLQGMKTSNFILTDTDDGVDIDMKTATPQNLNLGQVEQTIERLKRDLSDIVQILHNDTSYDNDAKVGILKYKEEEQSGAVASWQRTNEDQIANISRIILNSFLTIFPSFNERSIVISDNGIDGFQYKKPLAELKEKITPEVLGLKWKFAFSRPTGAIAAAAERQGFEQMLELYREFGGTPLPTIEKALFESQAKMISLDHGTSPFSAEEAFNDLQRSRQAEAQASGEEGGLPPEQSIDGADDAQIQQLLSQGI